MAPTSLLDMTMFVPQLLETIRVLRPRLRLLWNRSQLLLVHDRQRHIPTLLPGGHMHRHRTCDARNELIGEMRKRGDEVIESEALTWDASLGTVRLDHYIQPSRTTIERGCPAEALTGLV
jgi:hypothetical protein